MTVSVCFSGTPAETQRVAMLLQQNAMARARNAENIEVIELHTGAVRVRVRGEDKELPREIARCVRDILDQYKGVQVTDFTIGLVRNASLANSAATYARRLLSNP
jgi:hypothetical protein